MNRNDLRRVDLNLLIVFETLMHERSVTRAAEKALFLGQPAISAALSRLRGLFDDPLFVRTGRSMEPTARAVEIFALLSPALDSISTAVSRAAEFDPATSTAVFRIGLSDDVEFALLPHAAQTPACRGAWHRAGGAPRQLHPDAGPAGLRRNFHRRQLHRRPAGQRQAQSAAPQPAKCCCAPTACPAQPEPRRLLRPPSRPRVLRRRPERVY